MWLPIERTGHTVGDLKRIQRKAQILQQERKRIYGARGASEHFMRLDDIAEYLGVTKRTLYNWEKKGIIKFKRVGYGGRIVGMEREDFLLWLRNNGYIEKVA